MAVVVALTRFRHALLNLNMRAHRVLIIYFYVRAPRQTNPTVSVKIVRHVAPRLHLYY